MPLRLQGPNGCTKSSLMDSGSSPARRQAGEAIHPPRQRPHDRFPFIVEALAKLRSRSCIIDAEAVAFGDDGIRSFDRIRYRRHDTTVFLYAFDLIELDGEDLRRDPLNVRKATLASVLARAATARSSSSMPASSAWEASCRSGATGSILRVARQTGSRARTRTRQP
jgi:hypothetical protein